MAGRSADGAAIAIPRAARAPRLYNALKFSGTFGSAIMSSPTAISFAHQQTGRLENIAIWLWPDAYEYYDRYTEW